jgi:hypothetical protein
MNHSDTLVSMDFFTVSTLDVAFSVPFGCKVINATWLAERETKHA